MMLGLAVQSTVMSLVLVYAGTPTIFANFRTFIRLYLIIFHHYITLYLATLHHTPISQLYVTPLPHYPTSHSYVAPLHCPSMSHQHCIATTLLRITTASFHIAITSCQVKCSDHLGL